MLKWFKKIPDFTQTNAMEELLQRAAWRLVRSAEDRLGARRGTEKLLWATRQLLEEYPEAGAAAEDYVRAAFVQFKTEAKYAS